MTPETIRYAALMLAAGIGIPVLAALNGQLGERLGSPQAATVILFAVGLAGAVAALMATDGPRALLSAPGQPRHLFLAGLLVLFYILSVTWVAPRFGIGNAIFFVLLGQMLSAAVIDHFGLFGATIRPVSLTRGSGIFLMAAGLALIQRG
jgi:transporter family-2 protein